MISLRNEWKLSRLVWGKWAYLIAGLCLGLICSSGVSIAQSIMEVEQGRGGRNGPWLVGGTDTATGIMHAVSVDDTGALKTAGGSSAISFAPGVPTKVTLSASTSATACSLTAGRDYEVSCTVDVAFRHGAATPTATLDDNQLRAGAIRSPIRMPTGSTCFAFISTSGGACYVALIPTT